MSSGKFEEIANGKKSSLCFAHGGGAWECVGGSLASTIRVEVEAFSKVYTNEGALALAREAAMEKDYGLTTSSKTVGGVSSQCWTYRTHVDHGAYTFCLSSSGALTEANGTSSAGTWSMTLTTLSMSVPAKEFTPPAKTTTLP